MTQSGFDISRRDFLRVGGLAIGALLGGSSSLLALTRSTSEIIDGITRGSLSPEALRLELQRHLQVAIEIEHATIPPYLTALYSIHEGSNSLCAETIRGVVIEEMLHLTLACNLLNAVGGTPKLSQPDFIPSYPLTLGFKGREPIKVGLLPLSPTTLEGFLQIEQPEDLLLPRSAAKRIPEGVDRPQGFNRLAIDARTIGEFYRDIGDLLRLGSEVISDLFSGDPSRQVDSSYYYDGGGGSLVVEDLASAQFAMSVITEQGEGASETIYDGNHQNFGQPRGLAHYFAFNQLYIGRKYQEGDSPLSGPTGETIDIDWDAIYPILPNARFSDYAGVPDIRCGVRRFYEVYRRFLSELEYAFNGEPQRLINGVTQMYDLKYSLLEIVRNPLETAQGQVQAGPVFPGEPI